KARCGEGDGSDGLSDYSVLRRFRPPAREAPRPVFASNLFGCARPTVSLNRPSCHPLTGCCPSDTTIFTFPPYAGCLPQSRAICSSQEQVGSTILAHFSCASNGDSDRNERAVRSRKWSSIDVEPSEHAFCHVGPNK